MNYDARFVNEKFMSAVRFNPIRQFPKSSHAQHRYFLGLSSSLTFVVTFVFFHAYFHFPCRYLASSTFPVSQSEINPRLKIAAIVITTHIMLNKYNHRLKNVCMFSLCILSASKNIFKHCSRCIFIYPLSIDRYTQLPFNNIP